MSAPPDAAPRSLHVVQANSAEGWGGGEVHVLDLSRALARRGCRVTVACRAGSAMERAAVAAGLPVLPVLHESAVDLPGAWRLRRFCRAERVDVIHGHQSEDWSVGRMAAASLPGIRLVGTRHVTKAWKSTAWKRWVVAGMHRVIAVSGAVAAGLEGKIPARLLTVVRNGIDEERFRLAPRGPLRAELGVGEDVPVVGMSGRLSAAKGQDLLVRAAPEILARHPGARFAILGDDTEGGRFRAGLEELARTLGVGEAFLFLGHRADPAPLLADLDVAAMPSRHEALGLALAEAMAAGVPVVASRVGGIPELVVDGESGLLVEPDSPGALAKAVSQLLDDPGLAARLGAAGQAQVRSRFSLESMVQGTLRAYGDLDASPGDPAAPTLPPGGRRP